MYTLQIFNDIVEKKYLYRNKENFEFFINKNSNFLI